MTQNYKQSRQRLLEFSARFGFVTRDLFFEFLCPLMRSSQYAIWAELKSSRLIEASRSNADVFYLTKKGRALFQRPAIPARSIYFIEHDIYVAHLLLTLNQSGLVVHYWTERELRSDPNIAFEVLGTDRLSKFPDLVVELKSAIGSLKIAVEVERSQKTSARYDQIAMNYVNATGVGLLLFACETQATRNAIQRAFQGEYFQRAAKIPATLLLENFTKMRAGADIKFLDRTMSFKKLILAALKRPDTDWADGVDKTWKVVHDLSTKKSEAA
ncbi:MAG: hypothetical protein B7Y39_01855 [Bdellovibrio sp. 28-41-41]|nr:MAG: hypothetical protein B7Y39_01855 [Bdellovibrio sp. 28-41-41]